MAAFNAWALRAISAAGAGGRCRRYRITGLLRVCW